MFLPWSVLPDWPESSCSLGASELIFVEDQVGTVNAVYVEAPAPKNLTQSWISLQNIHNNWKRTVPIRISRKTILYPEIW